MCNLYFVYLQIAKVIIFIQIEREIGRKNAQTAIFEQFLQRAIFFDCR